MSAPLYATLAGRWWVENHSALTADQQVEWWNANVGSDARVEYLPLGQLVRTSGLAFVHDKKSQVSGVKVQDQDAIYALWSLVPVNEQTDRQDVMSPRAELLREAEALTTGDRNNQYGPPSQDFARSAGILNALGFRGPGDRPIRTHEVALILAAVKMSRLVWSPEKRDSWVDLAGYAACGFDCVAEEKNANV